MVTDPHEKQSARLLKAAGLCLVAWCIMSAVPRPCLPAEHIRGVESLMLPAPPNPDDRKYLGISGTETFDITDINASLLIIEFLSLYCSQCHKEARSVNELFNLIAQNPDLQVKVRVIGIGAGNTLDEVETFRKQHKVPFPLFADAAMAVMKSLGVKFTPTFICLQKDSRGTLRIVHTAMGSLGAPSAFAEVIGRLLGLEKR